MAQDNTKDRILKLYKKYLSGDLSRQEFDEMYDHLQKETDQSWMAGMIDGSLPEYLENNSSGLVPDPQPATLADAKYRQITRRKFVYALSAAAAVLVLLAAVYFIYPATAPQWVVHTTGYQETRTVTLPDGSTVVLNANSELKYLDDISEASHRIVQFSGEGYFDVSHLEGRGFTVQTGTIEVNVLGTEFNLETRRDYTNVFLKEGKVVLETPESESVEMEPGDLVHYDTENKQVRKEHDRPADSALSWKEGIFTFTDLTGIQILEKMEDIYGKEFVIEDPGQLRDVIVVQGLPYTDWGFTREALELALEVKFIDSTSNKIIVQKN